MYEDLRDYRKNLRDKGPEGDSVFILPDPMTFNALASEVTRQEAGKVSTNVAQVSEVLSVLSNLVEEGRVSVTDIVSNICFPEYDVLSISVGLCVSGHDEVFSYTEEG